MFCKLTQVYHLPAYVSIRIPLAIAPSVTPIHSAISD